MMNKEMDAKEALARLSAYCSVAERCRADVEEKLFRWGLDSEARESIVLALEKDRFWMRKDTVVLLFAISIFLPVGER